MTATDRVLAIDLGTSGPKVALISAQGEVLSSAFEPVELLLPSHGAAEQRPEEWWEAIGVACRRALGSMPGAEVDGVCCTAQWSGTVTLDEEGEALGNAIIWMDNRGAPYVRRHFGGFPSITGYRIDKALRWLRLTGGVPGLSGKGPLGHIFYLRHEEPERYARTRCFLEPKDYLNYRLTGRRAASHDSITLHWVTDNRRIDRIRYDEGLLRRLGLRRDQLPDLLRSTEVVGPLTAQAAAHLGLQPGVPVFGGSPDMHSAAIGSGAVLDYRAHLYLGTSSWLICHVPFKRTDLRHNMASLPSGIPGRYFLANEQETAGACLTFLRSRLLYPDDELSTGPAPDDVHERFERVLETTAPGAGGILFTPWLVGERCPVDDHLVRGGFHNLSLDSSRHELVRAVFEGVALNSRWLLQAVESFCGRPMDPIRLIGGGARSDAWCQLYADVLQRRIDQVAEPISANLRGAALQAFVGLGRLRFEDAERFTEVRRRYAPDPARARLHDRQFEAFTALHRAGHALYGRLAAPSDERRAPWASGNS